MPDQTEPSVSRRQLLQAAGGVTFSALLPLNTGLFKAAFDQAQQATAPLLPLFSAMPYLQPGTANSKLVPGQESIVVAWQTNGTTAKFELTYGVHDLSNHAEITTTHRQTGDSADAQRINYVATLAGLELNKRYQYQVQMNGKKLLEGYFTTRKPRGTKVRFVAFGDNSCGEMSDHAIAYYAYQARPDFVMNTGDNVYNHGLDSEYAHHFFPVYNADAAGPRIGAPLLRSVPFYTVIANHDLTGNDPRHQPVADFSKHPDGLGYFTNMHLPLNGPKPKHPLEAVGDETAVKRFANCAGSRYPNMANYSYDYGDIHFLCLDSNVYIDPTNEELQTWIANDLDATDATWKIVVYHHPAFNVGGEHYTEQHMRVLCPLMEKHGVDVVLNGHEHNYQRTRPLRFVPTDESGAKKLNSGERLVPGKFTVDENFDGQHHTKPDGIIHIITGAGGNDLYDPESNENPAKWLHPEDNNVAYVARMISDRHSLTVVDADSHKLSFTQVDEWGREIDRFQITKA